MIDGRMDGRTGDEQGLGELRYTRRLLHRDAGRRGRLLGDGCARYGDGDTHVLYEPPTGAGRGNRSGSADRQRGCGRSGEKKQKQNTRTEQNVFKKIVGRILKRGSSEKDLTYTNAKRQYLRRYGIFTVTIVRDVRVGVRTRREQVRRRELQTDATNVCTRLNAVTECATDRCVCVCRTPRGGGRSGLRGR